jgi:hypothetical protein
MPHPYFKTAYMVLTLLPGAFGIGHLFAPDAMMRTMDFPQPATPAAAHMARNLERMTGIRNVGMTYLLYLISTTDDERLMGLAMLVGAAQAFGDGVVSRVLTGGGAANHWPFIPVIVGVCAGLMGYFD